MSASPSPSSHSLVDALASLATTENGAPSLATTGNARLNLFFKLTRDVTENPSFHDWLKASWNEDLDDTLKILFQSRDCRGGKGDRAPFLDALSLLLNKSALWTEPQQWKHLLALIPTYGRYLDWVELLARITVPEVQEAIIALIGDQLRKDIDDMNEGRPVSLLAKWIPSERKKWDRKTHLSRRLAKYLSGASSSGDLKHLRVNFLTPLRAYLSIVETKMCTNEWDDIEFQKVPSVAMHRLKSAFAKHTPEAFTKWIEDVKQGKSKVNASQVYPHDLVTTYLTLYSKPKPDPVVEEQWKALRAKVGKALTKSLVISDVSSSMEGTPMEVSIALGILIAETTAAPFNHSLLTFSEKPAFIQLNPEHTLCEKVQQVRKMPWGMNTNLRAVFDLILDKAQALSLAPEAMPERLFILSDMQFDTADKRYLTNHEAIRLKYKQGGYALPQIIYWNLRSNTTQDVPTTSTETNVALLSGYSPTLLNSLLDGADFTPWSILRRIIDAPRYAEVAVTTL